MFEADVDESPPPPEDGPTLWEIIMEKDTATEKGFTQEELESMIYILEPLAEHSRESSPLKSAVEKVLQLKKESATGHSAQRPA